MIVTKQLDLPEGPQGEYPYVSQQTPRTNLAKELEKYNRPPLDYGYMHKNMPNAHLPNKPKEPIHMPERPNILSKRPHFKAQYRYDIQGGPLNLSVKDNPSAEPDLVGTLDLSMKRSSSEELPDLQPLDMSKDASQPVEVQDEPMDFSKKTLDSQSAVTMSTPCTSEAESYTPSSTPVLHSPTTPSIINGMTSPDKLRDEAR